MVMVQGREGKLMVRVRAGEVDGARLPFLRLER